MSSCATQRPLCRRKFTLDFEIAFATPFLIGRADSFSKLCKAFAILIDLSIRKDY